MRHIFRLSILFFVSIFWASSSIALEEIVVTGERIDSPDLSHLHDMIRLMEQQAHFDLQESMRPESFVLDVDIEDDELEPCSDPVNGKTELFMEVKVGFLDAYGSDVSADEASRRIIAETAQELFGNNVSYAGDLGLFIEVIVKTPYNSGGDLKLFIAGSSSKSLYENILEQGDFVPEKDKAEEFACKAPASA